MTYTLEQVIEGLKSGRTFERAIDFEGGKEYLSPAGDGQLRHKVVCHSCGGSRGCAIMPLSILDNGKWEKNGWELSM